MSTPDDGQAQALAARPKKNCFLEHKATPRDSPPAAPAPDDEHRDPPRKRNMTANFLSERRSPAGIQIGSAPRKDTAQAALACPQPPSQPPFQPLSHRSFHHPSQQPPPQQAPPQDQEHNEQQHPSPAQPDVPSSPPLRAAPLSTNVPQQDQQQADQQQPTVRPHPLPQEGLSRFSSSEFLSDMLLPGVGSNTTSPQFVRSRGSTVLPRPIGGSRDSGEHRRSTRFDPPHNFLGQKRSKPIVLSNTTTPNEAEDSSSSASPLLSQSLPTLSLLTLSFESSRTPTATATPNNSYRDSVGGVVAQADELDDLFARIHDEAETAALRLDALANNPGEPSGLEDDDPPQPVGMRLLYASNFQTKLVMVEDFFS